MSKKSGEKEEFPTVKEVQDRILSLKPDPKKLEAKERKRTRDKAKKEKTKEELEHLELKQKLLKKENENFSKIYFLKTADNWGWQAFDNSALFFDEVISPKIGTAPRLKTDNDFDCRANKGTVFVREMGDLKVKLKRFGMEPSKESEKWVVFDLEEEFTEEDVERMMNSLERRWLSANAVHSTAKRLYPNLTAKMRGMVQMGYNLIRKMNAVSREVAGTKFLGILYEMDVALFMAQKSGKNVLKTLEKLLEDETELESRLSAISDFRDLAPEEVSKVGFKLQELRDEIKRAIKKEKKGERKDKKED